MLFSSLLEDSSGKAMPITSEMSDTGWKTTSPRTWSSSFSRSRMLRSGMMISLMPLRLAARIFSLRPPMGMTRPVSVSSPVIASAGLIVSSRYIDQSAEKSVMPADGPSLGVAPSGIWMCTDSSSKKERSSPRRYASFFSVDHAMDTDSCMTDPSCPVTFISPFIGMASASISSTSPPMLVHASPIAVPGLSALTISSAGKMGLPRYFSTLRPLIDTGSFMLPSPSSISRATLRMILSIDFS